MAFPVPGANELADEQYTDEQVQQLLTASARVDAAILKRCAEVHQ